MPLIENSRLLLTCQRCGKKFEVNSIISVQYPLLCPVCAFNKRAEDFNRSSTNGR